MLDRIVGADQPHIVLGPGDEVSRPLGRVLPEWRRSIADGQNPPLLSLPVPGDPRGLPGPGPCTTAALDSGEAVMLGDVGIVPLTTRHGSAIGSATHSVCWQLFPITQVRADPLSVPEAEHDMTEALRESATRLAELDVARWRPELTKALAAMRRGGGALHLPEVYDSRSRGLLDRAERLMDVLGLAQSDAPGAAVSGFEARARSEALGELTTAVRRARVTAYNAPALQTPRHDPARSPHAAHDSGDRV